MDLLIIGRGGQLSLSLLELAQKQGLSTSVLGRAEVDLTDQKTLRCSILASGAPVIINAAAYTAVDQAESEPDLAHQANALAPGTIAAVAAEYGGRLIHVSTDYVFNGEGTEPFKEGSPVDPISAYGRTKAQGEEAVRSQLQDHVIVRTSWVYSPFGRNFVKTMLAAAQIRSELRVVGDQFGNPTSALDVADGLLRVASMYKEGSRAGLGMTYHLAGTSSMSWAQFAQEVLGVSKKLGGPHASVVSIPSSEYPTPARRPPNSRLDSSLFKRTFAYKMPPLRASLEAVVRRLLRENCSN